MHNKLASLLGAAIFAVASTAGAATTIDATNFNLSYIDGMSIGTFDMRLLSDANGTIRIGIDSGLWGYNEQSHGWEASNGDFAYHQLAGAVRQGYRITSLTLTADVTGQLYVQTPPACGSCTTIWEGSATNAAGATLSVTQNDATTVLPHGGAENVVGTQQITAGGAHAVAGDFGLTLQATDGVFARGAYVQGYAGDHEPPDYFYDALSSIAVSNMVLTVQLAPVPEPSTYAMLLAGLGVAGWAARRRRA